MSSRAVVGGAAEELVIRLRLLPTLNKGATASARVKRPGREKGRRTRGDCSKRAGRGGGRSVQGVVLARLFGRNLRNKFWPRLAIGDARLFRHGASWAEEIGVTRPLYLLVFTITGVSSLTRGCFATSIGSLVQIQPNNKFDNRLGSGAYFKKGAITPCKR